MRAFGVFLLITLLSFPVLADDFIVKADSVAAVNETMERAKKLPAEQRDRFIVASMAIMSDIIKKQQAKGQMDQDEMDAQVKEIMHGKTLEQLEDYVVFYINN